MLSGRKLSGEVVRHQEQLEVMAREQGLAGLRVLLNPDAKAIVHA